MKKGKDNSKPRRKRGEQKDRKTLGFTDLQVRAKLFAKLIHLSGGDFNSVYSAINPRTGKKYNTRTVKKTLNEGLHIIEEEYQRLRDKAEAKTRIPEMENKVIDIAMGIDPSTEGEPTFHYLMKILERTDAEKWNPDYRKHLETIRHEQKMKQLEIEQGQGANNSNVIEVEYKIVDSKVSSTDIEDLD